MCVCVAVCVCVVEQLEIQRWIFFVFSFESDDLVATAFSKDLKRNISFSSYSIGPFITLGGLVQYLKGSKSPVIPKAACGYREINHCSSGTAAKKILWICTLQYSVSQYLIVSCLTTGKGLKAGYVPMNIFKPRRELML